MVRVPGNAVPARAAPVPSGPAAEYGFAKTEILPGNIGYIDIRGFSGDPAAFPIVDSLMAIVSGVDALIIDIGRNSGGGPPVIQHLSAYLFEKRTHLVSTIMRGMNAPSERWTSETVPGKRLPKIPVYLLTSRRTFSAAESFAFGLRSNDRVTIVGEPTGGGGHFGGIIRLTGDYSMFLPRGRTFNPRTNKGWEAEGIQPDVAVPYEGALAKALELARKPRQAPQS
jgi:C-terminal processing protease CtpA/Prc